MVPPKGSKGLSQIIQTFKKIAVNRVALSCFSSLLHKRTNKRTSRPVPLKHFLLDFPRNSGCRHWKVKDKQKSFAWIPRKGFFYLWFDFRYLWASPWPWVRRKWQEGNIWTWKMRVLHQMLIRWVLVNLFFFFFFCQI